MFVSTKPTRDSLFVMLVFLTLLCSIAEEGLRDFFPLPRVMTTIFRLCQDLFDIVFEEVKQDVNAWHPDTKLFRVLDEKNQVLGHFYFDPYIR